MVIVTCILCGTEINLRNTKGSRSGNTITKDGRTIKNRYQRCGSCYLEWKREERKKLGS